MTDRRASALAVAAFILLWAWSPVTFGQQTPRPGPSLFLTVDGTATSPARAYLLERGLGAYRLGAGTEGYTSGGALRWQWSGTLFKVWTSLETTGDFVAGGGISGASVSAANSVSGATLTASGNVTSSGGQFTGSGAGLTNLPASALTGNLAIARFNGGTSASSATFWRGDGTWAAPPGGGATGVPSGLILMSLTGSCPTGFTRTAALDGYYPRGDSFANVGLTSGAETHGHSMTHSHTVPNHQHGFSVSTNGTTSGPNTTFTFDNGSGGDFRQTATNTHTHTWSFTFNGNTASGGPGSTNLFSANTGSASSRPPTKNVVFCQAN